MGHTFSLKSIRYTPLFSFFGFKYRTHSKKEKSKDKRSVTASIFPFACHCQSSTSPHFCCLCLCDVFGASIVTNPPLHGGVWSVSVSQYVPFVLRPLLPQSSWFVFQVWLLVHLCSAQCIVSVFSLSWVSLSYTLATSRCLGGLAFVLTLKASVYGH